MISYYFINKCLGLFLSSTCLMKSNDADYLRHALSKDNYFHPYLMATSDMVKHEESLGTKALSERFSSRGRSCH